MRRWHQELHITLRNWRAHRRSHVERNKDYNIGRIGEDPYTVDCECDEQVGRFRKKDAFDCGNTRCYICHSDKLPKRQKTEQEVKSDLDFREQLNERKSSHE